MFTVLLMTWFAGSVQAAGQQEVALPYEELAAEFFVMQGLDPSEAAGVDDLLDSRFAHVRLGAYDVRFPLADLTDPDRVEDLRELSGALFEGQRIWLDWLEPAKPSVEGRAARNDLDLLSRWARSWKTKHFAGLDAGSGADLDFLEQTRAKPAVRAAAERFAVYMGGGGPLASTGAGAEEHTAVRLVLLPSRAEFVTFAYAVGWLEERHRPYFWVPGTRDWVEFRFDDTRAIALEFSAGDERDYTAGISMDSRNPLGMKQQVSQLAFLSLLEHAFGGRMDTAFARSLGNNLVIEQFGEVDTRSDGDTGGNETSAVSAFVPGGSPGGGALPPVSATSPWRKSNGKDHFVSVLRAAQRRGAKDTGRRKATDAFLLVAEDGGKKYAARAPFYGPAAADTAPPPDAFQSDWLEFQRAYRIAFVHWLREYAAGKKKSESRADLARLLHLVADASTEIEFAAALEQVYGLPISDAAPDADDLEGRFLAWLAKQK